ncbi:bifunctional enoyl-CoA hydratase/phosphate acetyltransferase [bacterium]|nr:bifunctional enoyl-CoA hydratase/phosphate acetyltransferase [bacterium]
MIKDFSELMHQAIQVAKTTAAPPKVVVAAGNDDEAILALIEAQRLGLATGILVGDRDAIQKKLEMLASNLKNTFEIVATHTDKAAAKAVSLVKNGTGDFLMKGKIKTAAMLKAVVDKENGLRTGNLISDVLIIEYPHRENKLLFITDGGINLAPDVQAKAQLIQNAALVAHALGNPMPKVALLSAVETVNPALPSTIDAAILTQMNRRKQLTNCLVDGPLAFDIAISPDAAAMKGIESPVAGNAEILICPNIETANIMVKAVMYFTGQEAAHTCVGAKVPVLIPSRSDSAAVKLHSIALSILVADYQRRQAV